MPIAPDFLAVLACPACRGALVQRDEDFLDCPACGRRYPVRDNIPVLLVEEALTPSPADSCKEN